MASRYLSHEAEIKSRFWIATETARKEKLEHGDRQLLRESEAKFLHAVNFESRIIWAKAFCKVVEGQFKLKAKEFHPAQPMFLGTFVDADRTLPVDHRGKFDLADIKNRLRIGLRGLHFIGMIEPAFYANVQHEAREPCVMWHLHCLIWGISRQSLTLRTRRMNAWEGFYSPIVPDRDGAKAKRISKGQLPDKLRYILKSPKKEYRTYSYEVGGFRGSKHKSDKLRPGNALKLFKHMRHLSLDELGMAGGEGVAMLGETKARALLPYKRALQRATSRRLIQGAMEPKRGTWNAKRFR